jgi:hypothetical protein
MEAGLNCQVFFYNMSGQSRNVTESRIRCLIIHVTEHMRRYKKYPFSYCQAYDLCSLIADMAS